MRRQRLSNFNPDLLAFGERFLHSLVRLQMARALSLHSLLAGLGATVAGSFLGALLLALAGISGESPTLGQVVGTTAAVGIYGALIALSVVAVYGMPLFAFLRRAGLANPVTAVLFGALPGIAWVLWTHGSWLDPILWNGTLIALFYFLFRRERAAT